MMGLVKDGITIKLSDGTIYNVSEFFKGQREKKEQREKEERDRNKDRLPGGKK
jgi:hypothetical protein